MGIIQRQAISGSIITYLGVVIGFVTTALVFPRVLTTDQIGLLGILVSYGYIFAQVATMGTGRITIVFFPYFKDRSKNHHGFFFIIGMISLAGILLATAGFFLLKPWLMENARGNSQLLAENINYLLPLIIATLCFLVFDSINKNLFNAVQGIMLKEFVQRLLILLFILLFVMKWITFKQYLPLYVLSIGVPPFFILIHLLRHREFTFRPYSFEMFRKYRKKIVSIGLYGIIIGFSGVVILNIDRIMVERLMGLSATGIYTTMAYFATLIVIPSRALLKISDPIIAQAWAKNDIASLSDNYYRASINQFIVGTLLFIGIWGNIGNIERILPAEFSIGNWVVFFIGLAFLADMASGTATLILANSKYFKYQTYYVIFLVVLIIISNILFIPVWGITGAAIATFISKLISNLVRHQLLYHKFRLQPYTFKFIYVIGVSAVSYLAGYLIPEIANLYLDIIIRSTVMGGLFILLIITFKISPEVNDRYYWVRDKLRNKI
jgi:O-antigen/teichoic acid export membrane protein